MKPKISVITVSYNSEAHIEEAIQSVLAQDYSNKEYIIIDGASIDRTCEIIDRYKDQIDFVISEPDKGISDAFNKGIRHATGDVICIVNSDDIMPKRALSRFAEQYDENYDVFRGKEIVRDFSSGKEYMLSPTLDYPRVPIKFNVCHMATFIKKDSFDRFGYYDTDFKCGMDRELLFRFHRLGAKEKALEGVFGIFRLGGVSQSSKMDQKKIEESLMIARSNNINTFELALYNSFLHIKYGLKKILKR